MNTPRTTGADNQDHATQIIAEYMRRVDAGENVDREQFLRQHPDVAKELDRFLDNVALVEQMAGPTVGKQLHSPGDGGPSEQARRETVAGTQSGDSVPENTGSAAGSLKAGKFGRYRVEKTLGEGAMGTVYLARDTELDRRVALKVPKFGDDDREMIERFYREARSAAKLRHRNICAVHDIGEIDGTRYISMAYIEGRPLSDYVNPDKPPSERNVAVIVRKLAQALETAHREGVIHRDLKPANIMVDKKTEPVIMDFGLARQMNKDEDERLTQTGTVMGSPAYMSPEQVNADIDRIGPASDIYSLGVILYELLTGRLPYEGSIAAVIGQILLKDPQKPSLHRPNLDPLLESICIKMMAKQIDDRHATMKEVAQALTRFLKNDGKADGARPVGLLESFEPVELKSVAQQTVAEPKKSVKARRTVSRSQPEIPPTETFVTINEASGRRKPSDSRKQLSANDRLGNIPGWAWGIVGAFGALALVWGITLMFRAGDQTITVEIADELRNDPKVNIYIDSKEVQIEGLGKTIQLTVGPHNWSVKQGNTVVHKPRQFIVYRSNNAVLTISAATKPDGPPNPPEESQGKPVIAADSTTPTNSIGMKLVLIPAGEFVMGSPADEDGREKGEGPPHRVQLTERYLMGAHEVTVGQFRQFVTKTGYRTDAEKGAKTWIFDAAQGKFDQRAGLTWSKPGFAQVDTHPVVCVSWNDAVAFCEWLSLKEGMQYRLPTEAEWEHACRAGTDTPFHFGKSLSSTQANCNGDVPYGGAATGPFLKRTAKVGSFAPNAFGLYDMHGNVMEYCTDWFAEGYYRISPRQNPTGPNNGTLRVLRGGGWHFAPQHVRSAYRFKDFPSSPSIFQGFRVVGSAPPDATSDLIDTAGPTFRTGLFEKPITVDFSRTPLQNAIQEIGKLAGVEIRIDTDALKSNGYTLNMPQTLSMKDAAANDVLMAILKRYKNMVPVLAGDHLLVTIRKADVERPVAARTAKLTRVATLTGTARDPYYSFALGLSPDGSTVIDSLTTDRVLRARQISNGKPVRLRFESPKNVTAVTYSASGDALLIGTSEGQVFLQSLKTGKRTAEFQTAHPQVRKVAFDTAGRVIVFSNNTSFNSEGTVQRFDPTTRKALRSIKFHAMAHYAPCMASFSADGSRVAVVNNNRAVLYDFDTGRLLPTSFEAHKKLKSETYGNALGVALSPDGRRLTSSGYDRRTLMFDATTGKRLLPPLLFEVAPPPPDLRYFMYASPGLFSASGDWLVQFHSTGVRGIHVLGQLAIRDTESGTILATDSIPKAKPTGKKRYRNPLVSRMVLSQNGRFVATAGSGTPICVWRVEVEETPLEPKEVVASTTAKLPDLKIVVYKSGKPRNMPTFLHLRLGLGILSQPKAKDMVAVKTFKMTIAFGNQRDEFTDVVKAAAAVQLKIKELEEAGKPYTINGTPSAEALKDPRGKNKGGGRKGGGAGGGHSFGGAKAGGTGGGSGGKK